jgi:hypothetical protein
MSCSIRGGVLLEDQHEPNKMLKRFVLRSTPLTNYHIVNEALGCRSRFANETFPASMMLVVDSSDPSRKNYGRASEGGGKCPSKLPLPCKESCLRCSEVDVITYRGFFFRFADFRRSFNSLAAAWG